ncbi:MAG: BON domain-containing protein [Planctomycetales bacterium]
MTSALRLDPGHGLGELVAGVLASHPDFQAAELSCEVVGRELVITGRVHSYYQKQIAQEAVRPLAGLRRIRNDLQVARGQS